MACELHFAVAHPDVNYTKSIGRATDFLQPGVSGRFLTTGINAHLLIRATTVARHCVPRLIPDSFAADCLTIHCRGQIKTSDAA